MNLRRLIVGDAMSAIDPKRTSRGQRSKDVVRSQHNVETRELRYRDDLRAG